MTTRRLIVGGAGLVALALGATFFFASSPAPAQTAQSTPSNLPAVSTISATSLQVLSEKRVSRTVSDFTYRVSVRNSGPALIVVTGTVTSTSTATTFPDGSASFGDIGVGGVASSTDTITLRQDRTVPFNLAQLVWQFRAAPGDGVPPDPGPANDLTVAGIDSDNDGVRDDVERWIADQYATSARLRTSAYQASHALQLSVTSAGNSPEASMILRAIVVSANCLAVTDPGGINQTLQRVQARTLNTIVRRQAHDRFAMSFAGAIIDPNGERPSNASCTVRPDSLSN